MKLFKEVWTAFSLISPLLLLLFGSSIFISGCSQPKYISSRWAGGETSKTEINLVDDYQYDRESKLFYRITNDRNYLYIHLNAFDESTQAKLLMFGFTVWVDSTANNKKLLGIRYPLPRNERKTNPATGLSRSGDFRSTNQENRTSLINQLNEIELIGFEGKKSTSLLFAQNEKDIRGDIAFGENGALQYRLTLPLERIGIDTLTNETVLSLLMESGKMEIAGPSGGKPGGGAMGGGRRGGGAGMRGGGMGRNPQAMQGGRSELSQPVNIKLKIKLSAHNDIG
jgi:hypothetical protein